MTSFKPLEAFIYNEGFARISTEKYDMDPKNISNNMVHLTNYSIQKYNVIIKYIIYIYIYIIIIIIKCEKKID